MKNKISAKECSIWQLMSNDYIFDIPEYQRPYSWTENEALTLWDDLVEFWQDARDNKEQTYFIGSVVLVKNDDNSKADVIDGQQRISTLSLIFSVLSAIGSSFNSDMKKCLWVEGIIHQNIPSRARIALRKKDAAFFEECITLGKLDDIVSRDPKKLANDSQRLLKNNISILYKHAKELFEGNKEDLDSFIRILFNQCFFVVVATPDNESAFRVFSVMNNRGLSLLPSDIIKAHIIGSIPEDQRQFYTDKWEDIEESLGREAFNSLFSHIRMIYSKNKLHGTLVAEFERVVCSPLHNKTKIITDIIEPYAQAFKSITASSYEASYGAESVNEYLSWLNKVDDSDWVPVLMCAFVKFRNDAQFIQKFTSQIDKLASYLYLTSQTSNKRIEKYAKVISALQAGTAEQIAASTELSYNESVEFADVLNSDVYLMPSRKRTYLLLRLDRFISDKATKYDTSIFSIEHVLPQNPPANSQWLIDWPDETVRTDWLHKIANLIPLTRKKNSQAQNYDFAKKKAKYFCDKNGVTTYATATEVILENTWTPEIVAKRQQHLLEILTKGWELKYEIKPVIPTPPPIPVEPAIPKSNPEIIKQEKLIKELNLFFTNHPETKLPKLEKSNLKVGAYVFDAMAKLCNSEYPIPQSTIDKLCTIEPSKKYTKRLLPLFIPADEADTTPYPLRRYWRTKDKLLTFNGKKYYVFSQWYPDVTAGGGAKRSDFMAFYLDLALHTI